MTHPAIEIARIFANETQARSWCNEDDDPEDWAAGVIKAACLYMLGAMLGGGYCDFEYSNDSAGPYYTGTRRFLDSLRCRPLLQPFLESLDEPRTPECLEALLTAWRVEQRLTP